MVNYALLAANVIIFVMGYNLETQIGIDRLRQAKLMLYPTDPQLHQFFTSMFLHSGFMHLAGNMITLWVFGNAINDRLGNVGYAAFYLAGGVLAGLGHMAFSNAPVLGASGAISAVTGAYLVLLPLTRLTIVLWFYLITTFRISSMYFLIFRFVMDAYSSLGDGDGVAYEAHISGYLFGISTASILLLTKILPRDSFDLLHMIRSAHRRSRYRRMAAQGYDPFSRMGATGQPGSRQWTRAKPVPPPVLSSEQVRELELRREISDACKRHDLQAATVRYLELVSMNPDSVLPRQEHLDVSNQLMHDGRHSQAAAAYELFRSHHETYERMGEIYLLLGLLYGRYLSQPDQSAEMLRRAIDRLDDSQQVELARNELRKLDNRSDGN